MVPAPHLRNPVPEASSFGTPARVSSARETLPDRNGIPATLANIRSQPTTAPSPAVIRLPLWVMGQPHQARAVSQPGCLARPRDKPPLQPDSIRMPTETFLLRWAFTQRLLVYGRLRWAI